MNRRAANFLGAMSIVVEGLMWTAQFNKDADVLAGAFPVLFLLAVALPAIAAWRASKMWLLMLFSPVILYGLALSHLC